jgi:hypothetical protein
MNFRSPALGITDRPLLKALQVGCKLIDIHYEIDFPNFWFDIFGDKLQQKI